MRRLEYRGRGWIALMLGVLGRLTLLPALVAAQAPVVIPGLPGANLAVGARPSSRYRPYSDLPGGKADGLTGETVGPPPTARDALFARGIVLRVNLSQLYQGVTSGGFRRAFPTGSNSTTSGRLTPRSSWAGRDCSSTSTASVGSAGV